MDGRDLETVESHSHSPSSSPPLLLSSFPPPSPPPPPLPPPRLCRTAVRTTCTLALPPVIITFSSPLVLATNPQALPTHPGRFWLSQRTPPTKKRRAYVLWLEARVLTRWPRFPMYDRGKSHATKVGIGNSAVVQITEFVFLEEVGGRGGKREPNLVGTLGNDAECFPRGKNTSDREREVATNTYLLLKDFPQKELPTIHNVQFPTC